MGAFSHKPTKWEPPLELQRSTPREVRLTGTGQATVALMLILVVAAILGSAALASKAAKDQKRWTAMQADAASVTGHVTAPGKRGKGDKTKYYIDYAYVVNELTHTGAATVRSQEWRRMHEGDAIEVFYTRSDPAQSWIAGHAPAGVPRWTALLLGIPLLAPVPILAYVVRRQRRLLEEGHAAVARVTMAKKIRDQHGNAIYRLKYEFQTLSGAMATGKADARKNVPLEGSEMVVIYHPEEPSWNKRYPLDLVKVAME